MAISVEQVLEQVRSKSIRSMRHLCFETSRSLKPEDAFDLAGRLFLNSDPYGAMAGTLTGVIPSRLFLIIRLCNSMPELKQVVVSLTDPFQIINVLRVRFSQKLRESKFVFMDILRPYAMFPYRLRKKFFVSTAFPIRRRGGPMK